MSLRFAIAAIALACAFPQAGHAIVLDWNTQTWTPTSPSPNTLRHEFDTDGSAGTDVTLSLVYSTQNAGSPWRAGLPAIDSTLQGGQASGTNSLHLGVDFAAQAHTITVTVEFPSYALGVEGISFTLFDIDRADGSAAYIDQIRAISGTAPDGSAVTPVISGIGSTVTFGGSGLSQTLTGNGPAADTGSGSNAGNATISFSSPIRSFTLVWGVPNNNANNPVPMDIAFGNINFSPVPEADPAVLGGAVCVAAGLATLVRASRKSRRLNAEHA